MEDGARVEALARSGEGEPPIGSPPPHGGEEPAVADATVRRSALFIAILASFLTPFESSGVNIALPTIGGELHMDAILLSWVGTSYLLMSAAVLVPFGRAADLYGRKRVFQYGMVVWIVFSLLGGLAPGGELLVAFRLMQGVGGGMIFGTSVAILTSVYPASERGRVFGISVAAVYIGLSVGPFVGGLMTATLGWRSVFFLVDALGVIVLLVTIRNLKGEWAGSRGESYDLPGAAIYMLMLIAIVVGFTLLPRPMGAALLSAGVAVLVLFVVRESRVRSPVFDIRLFTRNRVFAFSNLATVINYSATFAVGFFMSLYLQLIRGLTPERAGLILLAQPIVQAALSPAAGRLSDRIEPRIVSSVGMALSLVGLLVLVTLTRTTPYYLIIVNLAILGLGFAFFTSPNSNAIMGSVKRAQYGVAASTLATMRAIGQTLSLSMAVLLLGVYVGAVEVSSIDPVKFMSGVHMGFIIFSVLCFFGVFASLVRGNVRGPDGNGE
jgi:EmrB/QacA subfamily drug resistance transporter